MKHPHLPVRDMTYIALGAVLVSLCAWITIPWVVPFTLQTLGIFCTLNLLGGRRGTLTVVLYVLMGLVGLPVFSGFSGGPGAVFGLTGGYILGFIPLCLLYWLFTALWGQGLPARLLGMVFGLLACYTFGTVWFAWIYAGQTGAFGLKSAVMVCVVPFLLPDAVKLAVSLLVCRWVRKQTPAL